MALSMREADEDDVAFIARLFRLPHARAFLNAPGRDIIHASLEDPNTENYILECDGEPAGNLVLRHLGFLVELATLVVSEQRCGLGTFALEWALRRAFDELGSHRVYIEIREDNVGTRRLCERLGWRLEGVFRDGFFDERTGAYKNLCAYGVLQEEYTVSRQAG